MQRASDAKLMIAMKVLNELKPLDFNVFPGRYVRLNRIDWETGRA